MEPERVFPVTVVGLLPLVITNSSGHTWCVGISKPLSCLQEDES